MGLFHCPMGAPFYDDEDCIGCDMCIATTSEEMVEASKKIRAYIKARAVNNRKIQKIAVAGKGGVGKSSTVTLLAMALRDRGYRVLVLDTDESNPGLYRMSGFRQEPKTLMKLLNRLSGELETEVEWLAREEIAIDDIPGEYILSQDGLKFLAVGKIDDPFQGCACSAAELTRDLMEKLMVKDNEVVVVDLEAGVESFGRGLERSVDTVLIIVEPSFESIALVEKIAYMAEGMGISRVRTILNKVPTEKVRQKVLDELAKKEIKAIGTVYYDPELSEAGLEGKPLGHTRATEEIKEITNRLLDEASNPL